MTFRATTIVPKDAFDNLRRQAVATKQYLTDRRTLMQQATCPADVVLNAVQHCAQALVLMTAWAATPGIAQYAKDQVADQAYDIAAEYVTMRDSLITLRDNLMSMFPKDGSQFLLYQSFAADGSLVIRTVTSAQLAPAVALITTTIGTIN